jgi:hypothetical protein
MCILVPVSYKKKCEKKFTSLKSRKKGLGSGIGSGSISQSYGSRDPDPPQNVTDPQHWFEKQILSL